VKNQQTLPIEVKQKMLSTERSLH